MSIFQWKDTYLIGIDEIDSQHQYLVQIINKLAESMAEGRGKEVLGRTIDELHDYTVEHFCTEERIFTYHGYPGAHSHKKEHAFFIEKIFKFKENFASGQLCLSVEVMNFLCDWLRNHIMIKDKRIGLFLESKGLE